MIRFVEIYKRHGRHELLSDIALTLNPGHFILITGANGSGKTSLLRIMAGLDRPDKAGVELMGQMRSWRRSRKALRQRVVYLHQRPYLFSGTVLSNLRFALSVNRIGGRPRQEKLERTISTFSLEHLVSREARRLSGGEQQRVALARACLTEPEVLLLDEPTANMDIASRTQFVEMLRHAGTPNQSIVLVSHDLTGMDLGCDAHYDLDHGKLRQVVDQRLPGENPIHLKLVK